MERVQLHGGPGRPDRPRAGVYGRYYDEVSDKGLFRSGDPVQPSSTATTVRVRNGSTQTTAGPAAPGGDQIIRLYVLDCRNQEEAVACGTKIPAAQQGSVEVRPVLNF